jgi:hypothetical protein
LSHTSNADPRTNSALGDSDPPEERTRLTAPDSSTKHADVYAAVCERISHDLDNWMTGNGSADASAAPAAHIKRAVTDGAVGAAAAATVTDAATGKLCSGQAMLQRVARARAKTAVACFEQQVVLMQLAAWAGVRAQQPDALSLPYERDRLSVALDDLEQHEPQRNREGVWREVAAGRHWTALVAEFGIGVAALAPSCMGLSNRG